MIERVLSGGQTGADLAGLLAAEAAGIPTGGYAPRGWLTEAGPAPWLGTRFNLVECPEPDFERPPGMPLWKYEGICYVARTKRNAAEADATLWFGRGDTRGFLATQAAVLKPGKRFWVIQGPDYDPAKIVTLLSQFRERTVNVAGNRESKSRGIEAWATEYLTEVFRLVMASTGSQ